jgi:hypothetical protein
MKQKPSRLMHLKTIPRIKKNKKTELFVMYYAFGFSYPKGLIIIALTVELLPNYKYSKITNTIPMMIMTDTHISSSGSKSSTRTNKSILIQIIQASK